MRFPAALALVLVHGLACAQVELVVGYPRWTEADALARALAPRLAAELGREVRVANRPGAGTSNAAHVVAAGAADGSVLFFADSAVLVAPSLYTGLRYDPLKSFRPVGGICVLPVTLIAHPDFKARSSAELAAMAKADPGRIAYGTPGIGTLQHLAMEDFERRAGISLVHAPYKTLAALAVGVAWNQVPIGVTTPAEALAAVEDGSVKALSLDGVAVRYFLLAPAAIPAPVVERLSAALKAAVAAADFSAHAARADWTTPGELAARLDEDLARWTAAVRHAGIKARIP